MPIRDDIHGLTRPPESLQDFLLAYGGKTPFQEPLWRLVLAQNVYWKLAGDFKIWDAGIPVNERGGIDFWHGGKPFANRPIRVESGMVERRKYPHLEGWILQKWFPPSSYPKEVWFAPENCMFDGTPKLGPYPQFGDYELIDGPHVHLPTESQLRLWIAHYWARREEAPAGAEQRTLKALDAAAEEEKLYEKRLHALVDEYMREKCSYIWSSSLEAGRIRSEVARRCGIKEHVGN